PSSRFKVLRQRFRLAVNTLLASSMPIRSEERRVGRELCAWWHHTGFETTRWQPVLLESFVTIQSVAATISACSEYVVGFVYAHRKAHTTHCKETVCVVAPYRLRNSTLATSAARILRHDSECCGNDFGLQ